MKQYRKIIFTRSQRRDETYWSKWQPDSKLQTESAGTVEMFFQQTA